MCECCHCECWFSLLRCCGVIKHAIPKYRQHVENLYPDSDSPDAATATHPSNLSDLTAYCVTSSRSALPQVGQYLYYHIKSDAAARRWNLVQVGLRAWEGLVEAVHKPDAMPVYERWLMRSLAVASESGCASVIMACLDLLGCYLGHLDASVDAEVLMSLLTTHIAPALRPLSPDQVLSLTIAHGVPSSGQGKAWTCGPADSSANQAAADQALRVFLHAQCSRCSGSSGCNCLVPQVTSPLFCKHVVGGAAVRALPHFRRRRSVTKSDRKEADGCKAGGESCGSAGDGETPSMNVGVHRAALRALREWVRLARQRPLGMAAHQHAVFDTVQDVLACRLVYVLRARDSRDRNSNDFVDMAEGDGVDSKTPSATNDQHTDKRKKDESSEGGDLSVTSPSCAVATSVVQLATHTLCELLEVLLSGQPGTGLHVRRVMQPFLQHMDFYGRWDRHATAVLSDMMAVLQQHGDLKLRALLPLAVVSHTLDVWSVVARRLLDQAPDSHSGSDNPNATAFVVSAPRSATRGDNPDAPIHAVLLWERLRSACTLGLSAVSDVGESATTSTPQTPSTSSMSRWHLALLGTVRARRMALQAAYDLVAGYSGVWALAQRQRRAATRTRAGPSNVERGAQAKLSLHTPLFRSVHWGALFKALLGLLRCMSAEVAAVEGKAWALHVEYHRVVGDAIALMCLLCRVTSRRTWRGPPNLMLLGPYSQTQTETVTQLQTGTQTAELQTGTQTAELLTQQEDAKSSEPSPDAAPIDQVERAVWQRGRAVHVMDMQPCAQFMQMALRAWLAYGPSEFAGQRNHVRLISHLSLAMLRGWVGHCDADRHGHQHQDAVTPRDCGGCEPVCGRYSVQQVSPGTAPDDMMRAREWTLRLMERQAQQDDRPSSSSAEHDKTKHSQGLEASLLARVVFVWQLCAMLPVGWTGSSAQSGPARSPSTAQRPSGASRRSEARRGDGPLTPGVLWTRLHASLIEACRLPGDVDVSPSDGSPPSDEQSHTSHTSSATSHQRVTASHMQTSEACSPGVQPASVYGGSSSGPVSPNCHSLSSSPERWDVAGGSALRFTAVASACVHTTRTAVRWLAVHGDVLDVSTWLLVASGSLLRPFASLLSVARVLSGAVEEEENREHQEQPNRMTTRLLLLSYLYLRALTGMLMRSCQCALSASLRFAAILEAFAVFEARLCAVPGCRDSLGVLLAPLAGGTDTSNNDGAGADENTDSPAVTNGSGDLWVTGWAGDSELPAVTPGDEVTTAVHAFRRCCVALLTCKAVWTAGEVPLPALPTPTATPSRTSNDNSPNTSHGAKHDERKEMTNEPHTHATDDEPALIVNTRQQLAAYFGLKQSSDGSGAGAVFQRWLATPVQASSQTPSGPSLEHKTGGDDGLHRRGAMPHSHNHTLLRYVSRSDPDVLITPPAVHGHSFLADRSAGDALRTRLAAQSGSFLAPRGMAGNDNQGSMLVRPLMVSPPPSEVMDLTAPYRS